jgi:Ca2+-binding RTX toxin-like protein
MSIPVLPTTDVKFVAGTIGLFGAAPGAAYLAEFKTFNADPNVTMTALAGLVQKDAAKLAAAVVANLGLTGAAATAGTAYLTGEFNANPTNHGKVVIDAILALTTLTADATFGAAATAVTAMVNKGAAFSAVATNNTKDLTALKAAIAAGSTNSGTTDVNVGTFTATNDTVNVTARTLGAGDSYEDKSLIDADVLNIDMAGNLVNPLNGVRIINVETININAQGLVGVELLTANATGVTTGAFDNSPVTGATTFVGTMMDFTTQTNISGTKTITVSGDSKGANLELQNVRDEVTLVDASKFSDDNSEAEGIALNFTADINKGTHTTAHTILGSTGADTITSGDGADSIKGDRGVDAINGGGGNDTISGDAGNDTIWGADGDDVITGGAGNDQLFTNGDAVAKTGDADTVDGGEGNDYIQASPGDTNSKTAVLTGGVGSDFMDLVGTTGSLSIDGQDDNDVIVVRNDLTQNFTADFAKLEGGLGGNDALVFLSNVNDDVIVRAANSATNFEIIAIDNSYNVNTTSNVNTANVGTTFTDPIGTMFGFDTVLALGGLTKAVQVNMGDTTLMNVTTGTGADNISVGTASTVRSGDGNDTISAGAGARVVGGAGSDAITLSANLVRDDIVLNNGGVDTISATFVAGVDKLEISASAFSNIAGSGAGLAGAAFVTNAGAPAAAGAVPQILYNSLTGALFFDADGAGASAAVQIANLVGLPALAVGDFVVVA